MNKARTLLVCAVTAIALTVTACSTRTDNNAESAFNPYGKSVAELGSALTGGEVTSVELVGYYTERIHKFDEQGPSINSIIALNPSARPTAEELDAERTERGSRGPLHGIPVVVKDNFDVDGMATTAGSVALTNAYPVDNSAVVQKLIDAGAIILAKTNLSEFATSSGRYGYSSEGGLTLNPNNLNRNAAGSSSGSGAAVAADFAALALGTDTYGSVRAPSAANGTVGIRPTTGLLSRDGIAPYSLTFDTPGPLAHTVEDAAMALTAMSGTDPADPATHDSDVHRGNYAAELNKRALDGARVGVIKNFSGSNDDVDAAVEGASERMRANGATVIDLTLDGIDNLYTDLLGPLGRMDFSGDISAYLQQLPPGTAKTTADVLALLRSPGVQASADPPNPKTLEAMDATVLAAPMKGGPEYQALLDRVREIGAMVEQRFDELGLDAMVFPTMECPASPRYDQEDTTYRCDGESYAPMYLGSALSSPEITLPVNVDKQGLPIGLSFLGRRYDEKRIINLAYSLEQAVEVDNSPSATPK
ncbi:aspartyl/glutamyl-tRNA amidotransferase subunit A [Rhodococcus opacus M213]|uniref:Aspartyl/glutamyl-tRNA amidotransferase subunit A n=1 Tax=Rhodococcus opacus M213 TaxID=1129896 RepID=K8Y4R8_RHOOP|nr:amidase family protein [Rhodococcus opacus]EKT84790.1 aspartyl/glutamyl-tRNA amidotransferase subunit A [Rhodococcus opacus M213]